MEEASLGAVYRGTLLEIHDVVQRLTKESTQPEIATLITACLSLDAMGIREPLVQAENWDAVLEAWKAVRITSARAARWIFTTRSLLDNLANIQMVCFGRKIGFDALDSTDDCVEHQLQRLQAAVRSYDHWKIQPSLADQLDMYYKQLWRETVEMDKELDALKKQLTDLPPPPLLRESAIHSWTLRLWPSGGASSYDEEMGWSDAERRRLLGQIRQCEQRKIPLLQQYVLIGQRHKELAQQINI